MDDLTVRQVCAGYFFVQAITGAAFWIILATTPEVRSGFEMLEAEHAVTDSFLLADLVLGILGSLGTAVAVLTRRRWSGALAMFVAGGIVYATLYILFWVAATGEAPMMLGVMVPPALLSTYVSIQIHRTTPEA